MTSEHRVALSWSRGDAPFTTETYNRSYELRFPGGIAIAGGPAPEFGGVDGRVDPEQALVAGLSSCHALTFLALAAKRRLTVESYEDDASCTIGKNADGKFWVDVVFLRPKVTFDPPIDEAALRLLHEQAHRHCFIANSVKSDVRVEPVIG
jgi:organic hydroperoxide reductase OsmC/OhrA